MGNYLSEPKREKESETGSNSKWRWGVSSMQGWRVDMEDSHVAIGDLGSGVGMFAVFDGHGGKEVAKFCQKFAPVEILKLNLNKDYGKVLVDLFYRMDDLLREPSAREEIQSYRPPGGNSDSEKPRAMAMLQNSIQNDLMELRERGVALSRGEAAQVMMKMMFLKKLEARTEGTSDGESHHATAGDLAGSSSRDPNSKTHTPTSVDCIGCTAVCALSHIKYQNCSFR